MKSDRFETSSEEETRAVGRHLACVLPDSGVVVLTGDLGAGKTTLTKGIVEGRALTSPDDVGSPTYTIIHEYGNPVGIYHVDLYRLDTLEEAGRLGLDELFDKRALVLIEWGERFPRILPPRALQIRITHLGSDRRAIEIGELCGSQ